ncbi:MAG: ATP-binding protein, partial [Chloroflexi bacterium]|nr:ATP-binding protein [Chloroflexota bacterium]MQC27675.1 PAS domain-containing protein [Chloroflexota bacterium]
MMANLELKSAQVNAQLEDFVNSTESVAQVFAEAFVRDRPDPERAFAATPGTTVAANPYLTELLQVHPGRYDRIAIARPDGTILALSEQFVAGSKLPDQTFAAKLRTASGFTVSDVFTPLNGGAPNVMFAYPMRPPGGAPLAWVILKTPLTVISSRLDMTVGLPESAKSGIFDSAGRVLAGTGYTAPHPGLIVGKDISDTAVWQQASIYPTTPWFGVGLDNVERAIFFDYPAKTPWITTVAFAQSELLGPLWNRAYIFSGGLLLSILGTLLLAEFAGRRERRAWAFVASERQTLISVVAGATDGILVLDSNGRVLHLNRRFAEFFDFDPVLEHATDRTFGEQLREAGPLSEADEERVMLTLLGTEPATAAVTVKRLRSRDLQLTAYPIRAADGAVTGRTLVARDVTDENRVRRMKSEFVAHASHQLRTPLTGILTSSELLLETPENEPATHTRWLNIVHSQALRMRSTINTLLNLSQIESGWISVDRNAFDLADEVSRTLVPAGADHTFDIDFDPDARGVFADADKVTEVLQNLLANAVKYSPDGGAITVRGRRGPGGKVVVEVHDEGVGIRRDDIRLLFSPYERASAEDRGLASGTGLGLYIVKSLVELHGGEVWVESELGVGTSFFFSLDHADLRQAVGPGVGAGDAAASESVRLVTSA